MTAFVLGAVSTCLSQLASAKTSSRMNLEAHLRADSALSALRDDIVCVLRDADLFHTRLLLFDGTTPTPLGRVDRDEILVFNTRLRPIRDLDFMGDGMEFETHFRIEDDALGPAMWRRRDAVPDEYPRGGGVATPLVAGVLSLAVEAYDGDLWHEQWDSDYDGLPLAVRVTVIASGHREGEDVFDAPLATLRTVVPIDRVVPPRDEALEAQLAQEAAAIGGGAPGSEDEAEQAASGGRKAQDGPTNSTWHTPPAGTRGTPPRPGQPGYRQGARQQ
jgi:hypothetical protein